MYYEEKVIDGKLMWRGTPDGEWREIDYGMISQRLIQAEAFGKALDHRCKVLSDRLDGPNDGQDAARLDFMERFIVSGTWWSGIAEGKIAWLADAECLRETIDEAMRVMSERTDATGTPQEKT